jgi:RES domain
LHTTTELLRLVASNAISPEEFERELRVLTPKGHRRAARKYNGGAVRIYRTRIWHGLKRPESILDLSYPPKHAAPLNRANLASEPVFYASAGLPASFVECRLERGQHVVCSEWRNTTDMVLQEVGLLAGGNASDIERIYHSIFTSTDSAMYKFSARAARQLLCGDQISGLLYSSIAAQNASHNLALKTEFVDAGLRIVNVSLYYLKNVMASLQYEIEEIDFALPKPDCSLDWKGRKRNWTLRKQGDELKMVFNGWSYDAYDVAGALVDPE